MASRRGYWCEALACTADHRARIFWLGCHLVRTPRLAMRWIRQRVRDIEEQLDRPAAQVARRWMDDESEHQDALLALALGEGYAFDVFDDGIRYIVAARQLP